jgi:class 3 adenylate cyclase
MPIFIDRHDLLGVTAADMAEAHRRDLEIQDQYGVRFLTYWFDQQRGTTFCLIDAPDQDTAQCVHREAHGHVAGDVLEVPLSAVEAFLGRIQDPRPALGQTEPQIDAGLRAILFTDIVGSTEMTVRLGDRMAMELVRAHDSIVRRSLKDFGGREVKHLGDGIMASFGAPGPAVECAAEIQRALAVYNREGAEPIHVRIGMDCGEPVEDSNDLFGSTVQLAARLCSAAAIDQILASENIVREHGDSARFAEAQTRDVKGFAEPMTVYEVPWPRV